jgi:integrase
MDAKADPGSERTVFWDEGLRGFGLMVTSGGHRSFVVQYRVGGRSRRMSFKDGLGLAEARREARAALGVVAKGRDPLAERRAVEAEAGNTLKSIAAEYLSREAKRLRSIDQIRATLERLVYPKFGSRQIESIRRAEIARLLDKIDDERGPVMADHTLAVLRRLMNWHAGRSDDFRSPIVRGMARTSPRERTRERTLTDDELRAVWRAAETHRNSYGYLIRFWILTATRRDEAARMCREELNGSDWLIPGARHKSKREFLLPLSPAAHALLDRVPVTGGNDRGFTFSTDGKVPISGFSKFKGEFDKLCGVTDWRHHDLRRTARSLMSRAGVPSEHAELALGHVIPVFAASTTGTSTTMKSGAHLRHWLPKSNAF